MVFLFVTGTVGYMLIEGWSVIDALYMTVITLSTVGFKEVGPVSPEGQIFTMALILLGVSFVFYVLGSVVQFMVEGRIREIMGRHKLEKKIRELKGHYIICGYGRVGTSIVKDLESKQLKLVLIERNPTRVDKLNEGNILHIAGDATDEENLIKAGIERARGLVTALKTDSDNVFVTLSARQLNPDLFILARAAQESSESKMLAAGASQVVCPHRMGAHRMAQTILRPTVTDFLELTTSDATRDIQMEEMPVYRTSKLINVPLQDSGIRKEFDLIVVAVKKPSGDILFNPSAQTRLETEDTVIAIGKLKQLEQLRRLLNPENEGM
ncbi:MAG: potassium channel protein [Deltaproteobacteria bacterium]|nr:potassium channel protein [Deltaproteobacteria bacterium]